MVAVGRVVQRACFIDDARAGFLRFYGDSFHLAQPTRHLLMQGQGGFHGGLRMKLRGEGDLEQHIFHDIRPQGALEDDLLAPEQRILEPPVFGGKRGGIAHFASQRDESQAHGAAGGVAGGPALA